MIMLRTEIIVLNFLLNHFTCSNLINIFFSLVSSWIKINTSVSIFFFWNLEQPNDIFVEK